MAPTPKPKPIEIWQQLNDRQRFYLVSVYHADQVKEARRRQRAAAGEWDNTPAATWRQIDAYHEPSLPQLIPLTDLQDTWAAAGHHSQGNGSTIKVLRERGLVTPDQRLTRFGWMHTLAMTRLGRSVARAGTGESTTQRAAPPLLSERSTEVLAFLFNARTRRNGPLTWNYSTTIEKVLMGHTPPLAHRETLGYSITDEGVAFYTKHHQQLQVAYPGLSLPDPAGKPAPWPRRADQILNSLRSDINRMIRLLKAAGGELEEAEPKAQTPPPKAAFLQTLTRVETERHEQLTRHARERAETARRHLAELTAALDGAVDAYAAAALAATTALVELRDPLDAIEAALASPRPAPGLPATGIPSVDLKAGNLYKLWQDPPKTAKRRGSGRARVITGMAGLSQPSAVRGTAHEAPLALANALAAYLGNGFLYRLLYAGQPPGHDLPVTPTAHPTPRHNHTPTHLEGTS